jgi:hypothetical protein
MSYAQRTDVSSEQSKGEIEKLVRRYGASKFVSGWDEKHATVLFEMKARRIRFVVPIPTEDEMTKTPEGQTRHKADLIQKARDQEVRRRWRSLALIIKAKLEAVESGIAVFESEFLANIVLPTNATIGETILPKLEGIYSGKPLPPLLGG